MSVVTSQFYFMDLSMTGNNVSYTYNCRPKTVIECMYCLRVFCGMSQLVIEFARTIHFFVSKIYNNIRKNMKTNVTGIGCRKKVSEREGKCPRPLALRNWWLMSCDWDCSHQQQHTQQHEHLPTTAAQVALSSSRARIPVWSSVIHA